MRYKRIYGILLLMLLCGTATAQIRIGGNVYGGCEIGVVTGNASVEINGDTVKGSVYGGGLGDTLVATVGAVKGNTLVNMTGGTVERSIYGGGAYGSVGTFTEFDTVVYTYSNQPNDTALVPKTCSSGGLAKVLVSGGSVGVRGSLMPWSDHNPDDDDRGWIFCGGQGHADSINSPQAVALGVVDSTYLEIGGQNGNPVITASVYGGCENGLVLGNTHVKIMGGQIGTGIREKHEENGELVGTWDDPYHDTLWTNAITYARDENIAQINRIASKFHECDAWDFGDGHGNYHVYDFNYDANGTYHPENSCDTAGYNGHSFFGNVFGGGSGYYPIAPGVWRRTAGQVNGNTFVEITGGHILTAVYGGNEYTDVVGTSTVKMTNGTIGVPCTVDYIRNHPTTGSLFGAGMGDARSYFNERTNVNEAVVVDITGGTIFGSVFGGGEDGHVLGNITLTVRDSIDGTTVKSSPLIGTFGTSSFDGNVFGGGRGFMGDIFTAGSVGGNITVNIQGGKMLGSVYGGGRLASVGTYFAEVDDPNYGQYQGGTDHGYITVNIQGGTIGNTHETYSTTTHTKGGNVYGGCMGRIEKLDGTTENPHWPTLAKAKQTKVVISPSTVKKCIKGDVFGGGELGTVRDSAIVVFNSSADTIFGEIFGGGYGSNILTTTGNDSLTALGSYAIPAFLAGRVLGHTLVKIMNGRVVNNVYGGGELASVGLFDTDGDAILPLGSSGSSNVIVSGGHIGIDTLNNDDQAYKFKFEYDENHPYVHPDGGNVYGAGKGVAIDAADAYKAICNANTTKVTVNNGKIWGSVYGGGADAHVIGNDSVFITANADIGTNAITSWDGNVFGGGKGNFSNNTAGRVGGNTYVKMDGGRIVGTIYGGGRLGLTGVDVNGEDSLFLNTSHVYDKNNHGLATIRVSGTKSTVKDITTYSTVIGNSNGDTLLNSDYSLGDIFGSGRGDVENYENFFAGNVANTDIGISGSPRIYGAVFGGGEMASIGYWDTIADSQTLGAFATNTGEALVTIKGSPIIGTEREYDTSYLYSPGNWSIYEIVDGLRRLTHTCTGNVFGGCQGDVDPESPSWVTFGRSRSATVNIDMTADGHIMSSVFGGGEQGTVSENTTVSVTGGTIGRPILEDVRHDTLYFFGGVFGGGYGTTILDEHDNDSCYTAQGGGTVYVLGPEIAGRVYGNTSVSVTGGKIHENVYGGGDLANVGYVTKEGALVKGLCSVSVSDGDNDTKPEIGLATAYANLTPIDTLDGHVYGGGKGVLNDPDSLYFTFCNANYTKVSISGGNIYGSVYGGGADSHVLGNDSVYVHVGACIGTKAISGWDGHVFGGGKGNLSNFAAGRVAGNTYVEMDGGNVLGNVYGGGLVARTGVGVNGDFESFCNDQSGDKVYLSDDHGKTQVKIKGGIVGDTINKGYDMLWNRYNIGNVYGGGRGNIEEFREDDLGRVANSVVNISNSPVIAGSVFGGGEMANVGHWNTYSSWYTTNTGDTHVTIEGTPLIGDSTEFDHDRYMAVNPQNQRTLYDTINDVRMLQHTRTGNVFGGGQGKIKLNEHQHVVGTELGHCKATSVSINMSEGGKILSDVYGGSEEGAVWGNTVITIAGDGIIGMTGVKSDSLTKTEPYTHGTYNYGSVYGGSLGSDAHRYLHLLDPTLQQLAAVNDSAGHVYGDTYVSVTGGKIRGNVYGGGNLASVVDTVGGSRGNCVVVIGGGEIGPMDDTGLNANVYGGGKGFPIDPNKYRKAFANVASGKVTVSGGKIKGSVFGGGADSHVLGNDTVYILPGAEIGTDGLSTLDGNVFGGGRNYFNTNHTNGRVAGNIYVEMRGGTLQGSIFGGGRMALSGVNEDGVFPTTSWDIADHGNVTIKVSGGNIGNYDNDGLDLLTLSDESVGDIFGSGKGDTHNYADTVAGCVTSTNITITGDTRIYGAVFGGGEMATVGQCGSDGKLIEGTGSTFITIGTEGGSDNPTIGTTKEFDVGYLTSASPEDLWTIYQVIDGKHAVTHTCTGNVFGGSQGDVDLDKPHWVSMARARSSEIVINRGTIMSEVFGGSEQGTMAGDTKVTIKGGTIGTRVTSGLGSDTTYYFGGVYGAGYGSDDPSEDNSPVANDSTGYATPYTPLALAGRTYGNAEVNILGGTVLGSVFGGAAFANVGYGDKGNTTLNIGSALQSDYDVQGSFYGANNNNGTVMGDVEVNVNAGTIGVGNVSTNNITRQSDVFGGGLGENTSTKGNVTVTVDTLNKVAGTTIFGNVYGGSALGTVNDSRTDRTTVNIMAGTLATQRGEGTTFNHNTYYTYTGGNVFGGGLGVKNDANKGKVNGQVTVNIGTATYNPTSQEYENFKGDATIKGNIYGCNNTGGSPQDSVTVNIFKTGHTSLDSASYVSTAPDPSTLTFAINNVFGGGNEANTVEGKKTRVNIIGCDNTVERVFGGGNAAASYHVYTDIQGGRFDKVFGGGNGEIDDEHAANILGNDTLAIHGGKVNLFFVGSNENGTIYGYTYVTVDDNGPCPETDIEEFFCGGNYVHVIGDVNATISCSQGMNVKRLYGGCNQAYILKKSDGTGGNVNLTVEGGEFECVYGGSKGRPKTVAEPDGFDAYIEGNVNLTIKGGTIDTVYGGSNILGSVHGKIVVNIDDAGNTTCPLVVHNVYGGGHDAPYAPDTVGYYPEVNVLHGVISKKQMTDPDTGEEYYTGGNVFGGGYGESATVNSVHEAAGVTNGPKVTIGGRNSSDEATVEGNVYGGGHGANVTGHPHVILDGKSKVDVMGNVFGGGKEAIVTGNPKVEVK